MIQQIQPNIPFGRASYIRYRLWHKSMNTAEAWRLILFVMLQDYLTRKSYISGTLVISQEAQMKQIRWKWIGTTDSSAER